MSEDLEIQKPIEKIFVSVRLRPFNEKERARNSTSDWECINNDTIVFKNSLLERSMLPAAYTFDRVFDGDCPTTQVYEEGAKDIALSVLNGFNSSIFAYGQTSSGKTYTMRGITDHAVADMYDYMERNKEREFLVKFSAMEIYNEAVRDLLSTDSTPLRLLDDPERGTVVEKLTEETLRGQDHLEELLSICEAQRQIGETALNETSSRSHQILRLTIESSAREYAGAGNSSMLAASVNFIDLAGSERASQTLAAGARLKEGSHINRSLLTLGTVIRKLSKGKNSHVPYRDSKLTRILQNALGGNARTAIICTMSPDRSHVEQSRNTLLFASCANEVETNAKVNLVMSDKALVKQLQKELAKLENKMKSLGSTPVKHDIAGLLREKDLLIEQMAKEIEELTRQRDLAQSRLENLLLSVREVQMLRGGEYSSSNSSEVANVPYMVGYSNRMDIVEPSVPFTNNQYQESLENSQGEFHLSVPMTNNQYQKPLENSQEEFHLDGITAKFVGPDPCKGLDEVAQKMDEELEDNCKEVRCIEFEDSNIKMNDEAKASYLSDENNEGKLSVKTDELSIDPLEHEGKMNMKKAFIKEIEADNMPVVHVEERKVSLTDPEDIEGKLTGRVPTIEKQEDDSFSSNPKENQGNLDMIISTKESVVSLPKNEDLQSHVSMKGKVVSLPKKEDLQSHVSMMENVVSSLKKEDLQSYVNRDESYKALEQQIQELQGTIKFLVSFHKTGDSPSLSDQTSSSSTSITKCRSCRAIVTTVPSSPTFEKAQQNESIPPSTTVEKDFLERENTLSQKLSGPKDDNRIGTMSRSSSQTSFSSDFGEALSMKDIDMDDNNSELSFSQRSRKSFASGSTRRTSFSTDFSVAGSEKNPQSEKQIYKNSALETKDKTENSGETNGSMKLHSSWPLEFENLQRKIIELWHTCNVPLTHRTYFILLFKGDPSDSVYMEVEFRRLTFIKNTMPSRSNSRKDIPIDTRTSSAKELIRERRVLWKQLQKKFSKKQREELYKKWGIGLNTKQRSLQLARRVWTNTQDMGHVKESADLVAKLLGFVDTRQAAKEVVGLNILPRAATRRSSSWRRVISPML